MHSKWVFKHFRGHGRNRFRLLVLLWLIGLLAGILLCCGQPIDHSALFLGVFSIAPSPIGLLLVCVFPIVLQGIGAISSLHFLSYAAMFLCAVSYGFSGILMYMAQGSAAWLLRAVLLFSSNCTSVVMWWLILQTASPGSLSKKFRLACILCCLVFAIDILFVSPLSGDLVMYF